MGHWRTDLLLGYWSILLTILDYHGVFGLSVTLLIYIKRLLLNALLRLHHNRQKARDPNVVLLITLRNVID